MKYILLHTTHLSYFSIIYISTPLKYYNKNCNITKKNDKTTENGRLYPRNIFCRHKWLVLLTTSTIVISSNFWVLMNNLRSTQKKTYLLDFFDFCCR